ncbi:hypothetical protein [Streptomyces sp. NRRL F-5123]|uniref:hypothetical protein n=1 Tax=Streptomyces sp. NRRL F-5123 TaxID=1463856 RepID=UPI0005B797FB|nr:hypothetical protein [Streptomyces sp. NRRL F-5123]
MKFSKVAAVVAGSVMAVGVGAPAFASTTDTANPVDARTMSTMPTSVNGGVDQALAEQPLQKAADSANLDSTVRTIDDAGAALQGQAPAVVLVGDASGAAQDLAGSALVAGAVPGAALIGGLPMGALAG